ncbi:hybrid CAP effector domain/patatin phospholipase protein [Mizugakiibacter sediminis]|uniref:Hybrid CAP effector domain/patatin phospholipase protein n=2 Tax=Mizugakiibacter sediminis TaxID=1475481 RepID=A0A0K8QJC0_9GAMM|nr:hybrid CAP effector domain/patatin phospholipase protein [Mizugakiibacter sediminis]
MRAMDAIDPPDIRELLRKTQVFAHLDDAQLAALEAELVWFSLPGGQTLFEADQPPQGLYVVRTGSLGVFHPPVEGGPPRLAAVRSPGQTLGELALITDQPPGVSLRALRDSELLWLSREGFDRLVRRHPEAMLGAARIAVQQAAIRATERVASTPRTFVVLAFDGQVDARGVVAQLRHALLPYGDCLVIDAALGHGRSSEWYAEREAESHFVLYLADGPAEWRRLCIRQADAFLLLVNAGRRAEPWPEAGPFDPRRPRFRARHLLLLHPDGRILPGAARRWLEQLPAARHHHVRGPADIARVARLISGRSTGLVLSGGGARGFAHIGVVRALREAGIAIDAVGGTSIGAIIGAGVACGWDDAAMLANYRRAFVEGKPLRDWTLPFIALTRGRRTSLLLREAFGAHDIEDLPIPFFCLSADLTGGHAVIHRDGPLWLWLRASSAIPGVLPPVLHRGHVYVDGAVINNLPVDVLREDGLGEIIAVDIGADDVLRADVEEWESPPWWRLAMQRWRHRDAPRRPGLISLLLRAGMVNAEAAGAGRRAAADLLLHPSLGNVQLLDWRGYERIVEAGYAYARDALPKAGIVFSG